MSSLFLVTSAIHTKHGVFSAEERLEQTIQTFKSIHERAPDSKILLIECSGEKSINQAESEKITPYVVGILNFHEDQQVRSIYHASGDNWDIAKNITELTVFGKALNFILKDQPHLLNDIQRVFKLSGRYRLNQNFDLSIHLDPANKDNYIFSNRRTSQFPIFVTNGLSQQIMSRCWSWPAHKSSLVFFRYNLMVEDFVGSNHQGKYRDIEHLLLKYFDGPHMKEIPVIGVVGNIGPNGNLVED